MVVWYYDAPSTVKLEWKNKAYMYYGTHSSSTYMYYGTHRVCVMFHIQQHRSRMLT